MIDVTTTARTVDEATEIALKQLGITKEQAEISVIEEGKKGFLGIFGSKLAVVKVVKKPDPVNPIKIVETYLEQIIKGFEIEANWSVREEGKNIFINLSGEKIALLIGKRGSTLNSLQQLLQLVFNRYSKQFKTIVVDAENYREKRKETLESLAKKLARTVSHTKETVELEPMPAFERKIIHSIITQYDYLQTGSVGVEPNRRITISYKK